MYSQREPDVMRCSRRSCPRGFTLFEILITLFIFSVVLSTIFAAYSGTCRVIQETESTADIYEQARIAMERICEDLESMYVPQDDAVLKKRYGDHKQVLFSGETVAGWNQRFDRLTFLSLAHLNFDGSACVMQPAEIIYYIKKDTEETPAVLYRSDTLLYQEESTSGTGGFPICEGLSEVDFTYYDTNGVAHDTWNAAEMEIKQKVPSRVDVVFKFDGGPNNEAPIVFKTGVVIPGAGEERGAS